MRAIVILILAVALTGCTAMNTTVRDADGVRVNYLGDVQGAVAILRAVDDRPYDLVEGAVEKGMATTLRQSAEGDVSFSAGYGYGGYGYAGGNVLYAAPDVVSVPGGWYAPTGAGSSLPVLGRTVATGAGGGTGAVPGSNEFVTREEFHALIRNIKKK